ncbi:alpha/beta hydrolase [Clostridium nigeriense]|uniref:alpha/beta hydrolase n=1 Tax=Clostridium nigeriense TaxID=1805470 RepID=UPI00082C750C|nr:alpha/beta hydrolase [Clostridium nigeriense]
MKKLSRFLAVFFASLILTTCSIFLYFKNSLIIIYRVYEQLNNNNDSIATLGQLTDYKVTEDMDIKGLKYKKSDSKEVFLDIYTSKNNNTPSPVILYVHGGSWIYGDNGIPIGLEPIIKAFNDSGFTIISLSYELLKENTPIENPIKDVKDSIRWIYKNKDKYNFDTNNIGVLGISSGAHLALMASYSKDNEFIGDTDLSNYPSKVNYIIDVFGPTDLSTLDTSSVEDEYKSEIETLINSPNIINNYSPINYISNSSPSTLIIHSKTDEIVPYKNATTLYDSLENKNLNPKLLTLNSGSHFFNGYNSNEIIALIFEVLKFIEINKEG